LASPIGQRVNLAGLFSKFFDDVHLTPSQMAAWLLHREAELSILKVEDPATAAALRRRLGKWVSLYDKLRGHPARRR
jgi:hypothetical protein